MSRITEREAFKAHVKAICSSSWLLGQNDYFSWGRDKRHSLCVGERLNGVNICSAPKKITSQSLGETIKRIIRQILRETSKLFKAIGSFANSFGIEGVLISSYSNFHKAYNLLSDNQSKILFAELVSQRIAGCSRVHLSEFSKDFIDNYELCSAQLLKSTHEKLDIYGWKLYLTKSTPVDNVTIAGIHNIITFNSVIAIRATVELWLSHCQEILLLMLE